MKRYSLWHNIYFLLNLFSNKIFSHRNNMCIKWDSTEWGTIDCLNHDDIEELQVLLSTSYKNHWDTEDLVAKTNRVLTFNKLSFLTFMIKNLTLQLSFRESSNN